MKGDSESVLQAKLDLAMHALKALEKHMSGMRGDYIRWVLKEINEPLVGYDESQTNSIISKSE